MQRKKDGQIDKDEYIRKHMELDSYDFIFSELKKSIDLGEQIDLANFFKEYEKEEIREEISKLRQEIGLLIV